MNVAQPKSRLILLEFNELCPGLIDKFIAEDILPNFKRLKSRSETFVTHTDDAVLEPWIQWVTLHTGVPLKEHGIFDLDEAEKLRHQPFWDQVGDSNLLLVSPMNVKFTRKDDSIFIPDPWAASQNPSKEVQDFCAFVRSAVNNHAKTDSFNKASAVKAATFLWGHGLSLGGIKKALGQLWLEKFGRKGAKWKRATVLDRLLWDIFAFYWKSYRKPQVGVFFSNATAHYQHKYWAHHDPDIFSLKPSDEELQTYGQAIRFGYMAHDKLIGKALELAGNKDSIALCTALSQQPMRDYEARGGKAMFIARDYKKLLPAVGVGAAFREEPLMAEESWLHFGSEAEQLAAMARLQSTKTSNGHPVFKLRAAQGGSFIIGCGVFVSEVEAGTALVDAQGNQAGAFADFFIQMPTVTSAKHHPDGIFWLATPRQQHSAVPEAHRLPLTAVRKKLEEALAI